MKSTTQAKNKFIHFFRHSHQEIHELSEQLQQTLTRLQFEGKIYRGRNLKQLMEVVEGLEDKALTHMSFQEVVLFPFLETHVPKLESLLQLLRSEHREFESHLMKLKASVQKWLKQRSESSHASLMQGIQEIGMCLIFFLRSHLSVEEKSIYTVMESSLKKDERSKLAELMKKGENKKIRWKLAVS